MLFSISLSTGTLPDRFKIAKNSAIYKSDDKLLVNNYHPISVLPFFPKILEHMMYNRLLKFLNENILISNQYGFSYTLCICCYEEWLMILLDKKIFKTLQCLFL